MEILNGLFTIILILSFFISVIYGIICLFKFFARTIEQRNTLLLLFFIAIFIISFLGFGMTLPSTWCDHKYTEISSIPATCTEDGFVEYHCDLCNSDKKDTIKKIGHNYIDSRCSLCGLINPKVCTHNYVQISLSDATCTTDGRIMYQCDFCGSNKQETIYSKGHAISHGQCTVCQFIDIETEEGYKLSCEEVDYEDICRYPDDYKGKLIYFEGEVFQNDGNTYLIKVTEGKYGLWEDVVYVTYSLPKDAPKILVNDIVKFYGECKGEKEYVTVLLSNNTVPYVKAKYIDIISE